MNEDLLRTLMTDIDPARDLSDETLDELVPYDRLMARVLESIEPLAARTVRNHVSIWRRVSFRVSAAAAAVVLVTSGAVALFDSSPSVVPSGFALGTVHSSWVLYNASSSDISITSTGYTTSATSAYSWLVTRGRINTHLFLDGLTITPPSSSVHPRVSASEMAKELWSTTALQGKSQLALGFGDITMNLSTAGAPKLRNVPVWVAIATKHPCSSKSACDAAHLASLPLTVVVSGYGLPNSEAKTGTPIAFVYESAGKNSTAKPQLLAAILQSSVSWIQDGPVKNGSLYITTGPFPCGALHGYNFVNGVNGATLTVESLTPESTMGDYCALSTVVRKVIPLTKTSNGVTKWLVNRSAKFIHVPTGPIRATK